MKYLPGLCVALTALFTGCGDNTGGSATHTGTNSATASGNPLDAPANYLSGLAAGQRAAVKTTDTTSLQQAIQLFSVDHGRNPTNLEELVQQKYMAKIPDAPYGMKLDYDAQNGTVKVVPR